MKNEVRKEYNMFLFSFFFFSFFFFFFFWVGGRGRRSVVLLSSAWKNVGITNDIDMPTFFLAYNKKATTQPNKICYFLSHLSFRRF